HLRIVRAAGIEQAVATDLKHGVVDIGEHHLSGVTDQARKLDRQVAGTAGEIEHFVARAHARHLDGEALEDAVRAERDQVVHDVVAPRHRTEHAGDLFLFLFPGDLLVTEVRGLLLAHVRVSSAQRAADAVPAPAALSVVRRRRPAATVHRNWGCPASRRNRDRGNHTGCRSRLHGPGGVPAGRWPGACGCALSDRYAGQATTPATAAGVAGTSGPHLDGPGHRARG